MKKSFLLIILFALTYSLPAQDQADEKINEVIRKHGMDSSRVMDIAGWLIDVHGPRLTGSPGLDRATEWVVETLKDWGMNNVHLDEWGPFGRGWEMQYFVLYAESPGYFPIIAYPKAWSPPTDGKVTGELIYMQANDEEDLEKYKGKLKGKFVILDTIRALEERFEGPAKRYDSDRLLEMANAGPPTPRPRRNYRNFRGFSFRRMLYKFIADEKPLALLDQSYAGEFGTVFVSRARAASGSLYSDTAVIIPQATLATEHYNRLLRMALKGLPVKLTMELKARYTNPDGMEHNVIAEIPGTDLKDEVVMFGAHLDSWHSGTGATDNGAGSSVMMEVARILLETIRETGIQPRRTLRLALWTGEEQGLKGSRGYVGKHFAEFPPGSYTPQSFKPEREKISAYYNLDIGTGKIRGMHLQGNAEAGPIFRAWLEPFEDMEANTITLSSSGGSDHISFDAVGIPAFFFIQDPIPYFSRTWHSNMDLYDHLIPEDLQQAAIIISSLVWHTAQRDEKIPRKEVD